MTTFALTNPSYQASVQVEPKVSITAFGDGYTQRVLLGVNPQPETWRLSWDGRTKAEILAIHSFLKTQAGIYWFYWTTPRGVQKKFICSTWSLTIEHDYDCTLTAEWVEDFAQ